MTFRTVSININQRCPLRCAHCSLGFSESNRGDGSKTFSPEDIRRVVSSIDPEVYDMFLMAGGEPSLNPELIRVGIEACQLRGLKSSIVTAPIWAGNVVAARRFVAGMDGLDTLILSYDRYHLEFLNQANYTNAAVMALGSGIQVVFQIAYTNELELSELKSELAGLKRLGAIIHEMQTVSVGNAADGGLCVHGVRVGSAEQLGLISRGCVLGNAFVDDDFGVHGCCWSTAAEASPFSVETDPGKLADSFSRLEQSPAFRAMLGHGLIDSLTPSGKEIVAETVAGETFASECDLCLRLMGEDTKTIWGELFPARRKCAE